MMDFGALENLDVGVDEAPARLAVDPILHGLDGSEIQASAKSFVSDDIARVLLDSQHWATLSQVNRVASKSSFDKLVVIRVGPSGELQLVYSHDDLFVTSVAEMLVDSASTARAFEVISRKTNNMTIGDLRLTVKLGLGKFSELCHLYILRLFADLAYAIKPQIRATARLPAPWKKDSYPV